MEGEFLSTPHDLLNADMEETLLKLSKKPEIGLTMRQNGCIPLLVKRMQFQEHSSTDRTVRIICNLISAQPDEVIRHREIIVFKALDEVKRFTKEFCKGTHGQGNY